MRYIIGIDLGTTNSCVAYVDTQDPKLAVHLFKIPQLAGIGITEALPTLPSFCYLPATYEFPSHSLRLPWESSITDTQYFVGLFAKIQGAKVPTRLVQSAKSWLCHPAASRRDKILPLEAAVEEARISPVQATARYLAHIKDAWNAFIAKGDIEAEFEAQEIVLTVPASFDEVSRSLTIEAARMAGFLHMTLLEEPQAAFYSWIAEHEAAWQTTFKAGDKVLVCDVGGGTTDFSLIDVVSVDGKLTFRRMAVGDHLLLGGDNMDAAIAHLIADKLVAKGHDLSTLQQLQLRHAARAAKEELLKVRGQGAPVRVTLQGSGSGVIQGTLSTDVSGEEIQRFLLDGFFGKLPWKEALKLRKTAGLRTMGLPYEDEPSIIKHLAHFLSENQVEGEPIKPDYLLFNGGAMKPQMFQDAIIEALEQWFPLKKVAKLSSYHLDLAVARGAAYYGKARRGLGIKIGGGLPRTYYIVVEAKDQEGKVEAKALTLMERGAEEGDQFEPSMTFMLTPNAPVSFNLCSSHVRLYDKGGDLVDIEPESMHTLPPIHTVLRYGKKAGSDSSSEKIPVHLQAKLTAIGTLEIGLKSLKSDHRWGLEFQVRRASGQDDSLLNTSSQGAPAGQIGDTFDAGYLKDAEQLVMQTFSSNPAVANPKQLMEKLEELMGIKRREWSPSVLRGLFDVVIKLVESRKISGEHKERWWNLAGFLLRPGFGYPADDFRMRELWKVVLSDSKGVSSLEQQVQMWICYRRIAGGMSKGQQMQLAAELVASVLSKRSGKIELKGQSDVYPYSEKIRALGAMELLDIPTKVRIGNALVARIHKGEGIAADYWTVARIGARHLVYGSIANVVSRDLCEQWIAQVLEVPCKDESQLVLLLEQLARKTEHREINLSSATSDKILQKYTGSVYESRLMELLLHENRLTQSEQDIVFGDRLPAGLLLQSSYTIP